MSSSKGSQTVIDIPSPPIFSNFSPFLNLRSKNHREINKSISCSGYILILFTIISQMASIASIYIGAKNCFEISFLITSLNTSAMILLIYRYFHIFNSILPIFKLFRFFNLKSKNKPFSSTYQLFLSKRSFMVMSFGIRIACMMISFIYVFKVIHQLAFPDDGETELNSFYSWGLISLHLFLILIIGLKYQTIFIQTNFVNLSSWTSDFEYKSLILAIQFQILVPLLANLFDFVGLFLLLLYLMFTISIHFAALKLGTYLITLGIPDPYLEIILGTLNNASDMKNQIGLRERKFWFCDINSLVGYVFYDRKSSKIKSNSEINNEVKTIYQKLSDEINVDID